MAEQLGDVEILQQLLLVRRVQHLLRDIGDAGRDARGELRDLLGDGRSNPDEHCHEESGDRDHHDGERGEMRKPGDAGERAMLAKARKIAVLAYQSAVATVSTMTTPSAARMAVWVTGLAIPCAWLTMAVLSGVARSVIASL